MKKSITLLLIFLFGNIIITSATESIDPKKNGSITVSCSVDKELAKDGDYMGTFTYNVPTALTSYQFIMVVYHGEDPWTYYHSMVLIIDGISTWAIIYDGGITHTNAGNIFEGVTINYWSTTENGSFPIPDGYYYYTS